MGEISYEWVKVKDIWLNPAKPGEPIRPGYNRHVDMKQVAKRNAEWDPAKIGVVVLSRRGNGKLFCVCGQHRVTREMVYGDPEDEWLCQIHDGLTYAEESAIWRAHDVQVNQIKGVEKFYMACNAKSSDEVETLKIVRACGLTIRKGTAPTYISASTVAVELYKNGTLADALDMLNATWGCTGTYKGSEVYNATLLRAMNLLVKCGVDHDRFVTRLRSIDPRNISQSGSRDWSAAKRLASTMLEFYNKHLSETSSAWVDLSFARGASIKPSRRRPNGPGTQNGLSKTQARRNGA